MRAEDDFLPCRHERCKDMSVHPAHDDDFITTRRRGRRRRRFVNRAGRAGGKFIVDKNIGPRIKYMRPDMQAVVDCPQCGGKGWLLNPCVPCIFCMGAGECTLIRWHQFKSQPSR